MAYDPNKHHRRSIRLPRYDYRERGAYFVTICTRDRQCVFGEVMGDVVRLSQRGRVVETCWADLPNHHPNVELDQFVVMPNHIHGVLWFLQVIGERATQGHLPLRGNPPLQERDAAPIVGATPASPSSRPRGPASNSLGAIVGSFKSAVSRNINRLRPGAAANLWQPNYYEHVIRCDRALDEIREYIFTNPQRWDDDAENIVGTQGDRFEDFVLQLERPRAAGKTGDAGVAPTEDAPAAWWPHV